MVRSDGFEVATVSLGRDAHVRIGCDAVAGLGTALRRVAGADGLRRSPRGSERQRSAPGHVSAIPSDSDHKPATVSTTMSTSIGACERIAAR